MKLSKKEKAILHQDFNNFVDVSISTGLKKKIKNGRHIYSDGENIIELSDSELGYARNMYINYTRSNEQEMLRRLKHYVLVKLNNRAYRVFRDNKRYFFEV